MKQFTNTQNYPNPFNPTTTIQYATPKAEHVTLKVYDELGNEVKTLANENKVTGQYNVQFNGSGLASGIYYYRITAGEFNEVKKTVASEIGKLIYISALIEETKLQRSQYISL